MQLLVWHSLRSAGGTLCAVRHTRKSVNENMPALRQRCAGATLLLLQARGTVADDCKWLSRAPKCHKLCDWIDIRAAGCGKYDTSGSCQWCSDFSALPAEECERRYFVDPWDDEQLDVRPCYHVDGSCKTRSGDEGRLTCGRKGPAPPPIAPPPEPPSLPPTSPPPSPLGTDFNAFDIVAIVLAALLTIPLALSAFRTLETAMAKRSTAGMSDVVTCVPNARAPRRVAAESPGGHFTFPRLPHAGEAFRLQDGDEMPPAEHTTRTKRAHQAADDAEYDAEGGAPNNPFDADDAEPEEKR